MTPAQFTAAVSKAQAGAEAGDRQVQPRSPSPKRGGLTGGHQLQPRGVGVQHQGARPQRPGRQPASPARPGDPEDGVPPCVHVLRDIPLLGRDSYAGLRRDRGAVGWSDHHAPRDASWSTVAARKPPTASTSSTPWTATVRRRTTRPSTILGARACRPSWPAFGQDLVDRWTGALFSLSPRNPDAARHFCTSTREVLIAMIDHAAPDSGVTTADSECDRTDRGCRRSGPRSATSCAARASRRSPSRTSWRTWTTS